MFEITDKIFRDTSNIIRMAYKNIATQLPAEMEAIIASLISFFILVYLIMFLRGYIKTPINQVATMLGGTVIVFALVQSPWAITEYYAFPIIYPNDVAAWIISTTNQDIQNSAPSEILTVFKQNPEMDEVSRTFQKITTRLLQQGKGAIKIGLTEFEIVDPILIFATALVTLIMYLIYWILRFRHLMDTAILLIAGLFLVYTVPFAQLRHVFWEWVRSLCTVMLIPPLTAIIMGVILKSIRYYALEPSANLNIGPIFFISVIGISFLYSVPQLASQITRGSSAKLPGAVLASAGVAAAAAGSKALFSGNKAAAGGKVAAAGGQAATGSIGAAAASKAATGGIGGAAASAGKAAAGGK